MIASAAGAVFSINPAGTIPDNACAAGNGLVSNIIVSGQPAAVSSAQIAIRVNIIHTYDQDLRYGLCSGLKSIRWWSFDRG